MRVMIVCFCLSLMVSGCATSPFESRTLSKDDHYGLRGDVFRGHYKVGKPYTIDKKRYYPKAVTEYNEVGHASWYGDDFHGRPTANGVTYDKDALLAAHRTLPLPCMVKVTNLENGKWLIVMVSDRGPYIKTSKRIIDLSERASELLGFHEKGSAKVRVEYLKQHTALLHKELGLKQGDKALSPKAVEENSPFYSALTLHENYTKAQQRVSNRPSIQRNT